MLLVMRALNGAYSRRYFGYLGRTFQAGVITSALFLTNACATPESAVELQPESKAGAVSSPSLEVNPFANQVPRFPRAPKPHRVDFPAQPLAPVLKQVPTQQPVAFITIDDGNTRSPDAIALLQAARVPISTFLISRVAGEDPEYFRKLQQDGVPIEAHSITHRSLRGLPYETQKYEICGSADELAAMFGKRPTLFRPPYGEYDETTQRAAHDCGMKAILYWREAVKDGNVYYQTPDKKIYPGDIILMHFRPAFVADFLATLRAIQASGLTPVLLENYIG